MPRPSPNSLKRFNFRCHFTNLSRGRVPVDQLVAAGELAAGGTPRALRRPLPPGLGHASVPEAAEVVHPVGALVEEHLLVAAVQLAALCVAGEKGHRRKARKGGRGGGCVCVWLTIKAGRIERNNAT